VPHPLVNQLACCLYAAGYTEDMNQAKAIAAVEAGGLTPSTPGRSAEGMRPRTEYLKNRCDARPHAESHRVTHLAPRDK